MISYRHFSKMLVSTEKQAGSCSKRKSILANWIIRKKLRNYWNSIFYVFERDPREEPELSRFHLFDGQGKI